MLEPARGGAEGRGKGEDVEGWLRPPGPTPNSSQNLPLVPHLLARFPIQGHKPGLVSNCLKVVEILIISGCP